MDLRQARRQMDLVRFIIRHEASRLEPVAMAEVRARAYVILDRLEQQADGAPKLLDEIATLREEIG